MENSQVQIALLRYEGPSKENKSGVSSKDWSATIVNVSSDEFYLVTKWGPKNKLNRAKSVRYYTQGAAMIQAESQIQEKLAKGYSFVKELNQKEAV